MHKEFRHSRVQLGKKEKKKNPLSKSHSCQLESNPEHFNPLSSHNSQLRSLPLTLSPSPYLSLPLAVSWSKILVLQNAILKNNINNMKEYKHHPSADVRRRQRLRQLLVIKSRCVTVKVLLRRSEKDN